MEGASEGGDVEEDGGGACAGEGEELVEGGLLGLEDGVQVVGCSWWCVWWFCHCHGSL